MGKLRTQQRREAPAVVAPPGAPTQAIARPRNPHLGRQLFGYSCAKTDVLLDQAAATIEQISGRLGARTATVRELESGVAARDAVVAGLEAELALARESVLQMERKLAVVGDAVVTAHEVARQLESAARRKVDELLAAARDEAAAIAEEARLVIDQAETRARALIEGAEAEADRLSAESERLKEFVEAQRASWETFLRRATDSADALSSLSSSGPLRRESLELERLDGGSAPVASPATP
jgi:chromosome segregation ATPase